MCPSEAVGARQRTLLNVDRRSGQSPLSISALGDLRTLWASTGKLGDSAAATVYLTSNGKPGGAAVFDRIPTVLVWISNDANLLVRSDGVANPGKNLTLLPCSSWELVWEAQAEAWTVKVTNQSSSERDFLVRAEGL